MERGSGAFPQALTRRFLSPFAWRAADSMTNAFFGTFWYRRAVPIFLIATWCYNLLYDYLWLAGLSWGGLFVIAAMAFGYGSTIGALFSSSERV